MKIAANTIILSMTTPIERGGLHLYLRDKERVTRHFSGRSQVSVIFS
jgi:hypothetical protein